MAYLKRSSSTEGNKEPASKLARYDYENVPDDVFDCPICATTLSGHIFQCNNGHHICKECLDKLKGSQKPCPSCNQAFPAQDIRNLGMEQIAANVIFPCRWCCGFEGKPDGLGRHHAVCDFQPIKCPVAGCNHQCPVADMRKHLLSEQHRLEVARPFITDCSVWSNRLLPGVKIEPGKTDDAILILNAEIKDHQLQGSVCHIRDRQIFSVAISNSSHQEVRIAGLTAPMLTPTINFVIHRSQLEMLGITGKFKLKFKSKGKLDVAVHHAG